LRDAELLRERLGLLQVVDPYIGRYYSAEWVRRKILQLSDEDISQMDKQIAKEDKTGTGGPTTPIPGQEQQQAETDANPPVDNTAEEDSTESKTPMLDADTEKLSSRLNRK
jgi:hypothetical protein